MRKNIQRMLATGIFICLLPLSASLSLCSCSGDDDNGDKVYTHTTTPEKEAHGTYTGTYVRLQANSSTAVPEEGIGTLVITPSETAYVANIRFECEALGISAGTPVNITFANDGFIFSNVDSSNPLGSPVSGRIMAGNQAESSFQLKIRQGRSTKTFDITFAGKTE